MKFSVRVVTTAGVTVVKIIAKSSAEAAGLVLERMFPLDAGLPAGGMALSARAEAV